MIEDLRNMPLLVTLLRRWWWLAALSVILALGATYELTKHIKPTYEATTKIYVNTQSIANIGTYTDRNSSLMDASTIASMITSYRVAGEAIRLFHLDITPDQLVTEMSASAATDTPIVTVQVDDRLRDRAAVLANALASTIIAVEQADQSVRYGDLEKAIRSQIATTTASIDTYTSRVRAYAASGQQSLAISTEIADLRQQINVLETARSTLNAQLNNLLLSKAQSATTLTVIDSAQVPTAPKSPNMRKNLLLGFAVGLLLAGLAIALIRYLDDPLRSPQALEMRFGLPMLATIPRNPLRERPLVVAEAWPRPEAEAFRLLRAALLSNRAGPELHRLLVVSGGPGEGKSTVAANLAIAVAQAGKRVVLIDADMRRPSIHRLFGLEAVPGLTDFLHTPQPLRTVLQPTHIEGLVAVCGGRGAHNPAELLGSTRMSELLSATATVADLVILDSPPALVVSDAMVLAPQVDGIVLVLDQELTTMRAAARTLKLLQLVDAPVIGAVINRLDARNRGYGNSGYGAYMTALRPTAGRAGGRPVDGETAATRT